MRPSSVLDLGPLVPRRGTPLARPLARALLYLTRWRVESRPPDLAKTVLVFAPHSSNWDFLVGVMCMFALDLKVSWLGKHTMFGWPWGGMMRWLGGIPVDRAAPGEMVDEIQRTFRSRERLWLGLAPEGTRSTAGSWRSGFWRIAKAADVPMVIVSFDFARREIVFAAPFEPTDDFEADRDALQQIIADVTPRRAPPAQPISESLSGDEP